MYEGRHAVPFMMVSEATFVRDETHLAKDLQAVLLNHGKQF